MARVRGSGGGQAAVLDASEVRRLLKIAGLTRFGARDQAVVT